MKKSDYHFEDDIWLDVVRGIQTPASDEVQRHLSNGCQTCESAHRLWSGVRDNLHEALATGPPEAVVRSMVTAFDFQRKVPLLSTIAEFARLLFDSSLEPVPFGVRGGNSPARHLLHESAAALIDLRIEQETSLSACITGQIHPTDAAEEQPTSTIFLVEDEQRIIASTLSNSLGEFQIEFHQQGRLHLYLEMPGTLVGIPIPDIGLPSTVWTN